MEWAHSLQLDEPKSSYKTTHSKPRLAYKKQTGKDADIMERKKTSRAMDTATLLSDVKKIFARIANADKKYIAHKEKINFFENVRAALESEQSSIKESDTPKLPNPTDNYPRYPGRGEDALEWLEKNWGKYLKYFGAEKDYLYQDQLRKLDPNLIVAITCGKYKRIIEDGGMKVRDIIPRKSERVTEKINSIILSKTENREVLSAYMISAKRNSRNKRCKESRIKNDS